MKLSVHLKLWKFSILGTLAVLLTITLMQASLNFIAEKHSIWVAGREAIYLAGQRDVDWKQAQPLLKVWAEGGKEAFIKEYLD